MLITLKQLTLELVYYTQESNDSKNKNITGSGRTNDGSVNNDRAKWMRGLLPISSNYFC